MTELMTFEQIRQAVQEPGWRLRYVLDSRGIRPVRKFGNASVYEPAVIEQVRRALAGIRLRKRRRKDGESTEPAGSGAQALAGELPPAA